MYTRIATKEIMKDSITNIFASKVKYTDKTFTNIDVMTFNGYNENRGDISYSNNLYTADYIEGGGGDVPFIHQEVQKVLKNNDKIELYVKTAFVDTEYIGNIDDFEYIIYKNFENNKFEGKIAEVTAAEFIKGHENKDEIIGEISLNSNFVISKKINQLNSYVYTFEKDDFTGEYYLSGFDIAK